MEVYGQQWLRFPAMLKHRIIDPFLRRLPLPPPSTAYATALEETLATVIDLYFHEELSYNLITAMFQMYPIQPETGHGISKHVGHDRWIGVGRRVVSVEMWVHPMGVLE